MLHVCYYVYVYVNIYVHIKTHMHIYIHTFIKNPALLQFSLANSLLGNTAQMYNK